MAKPGYYIDLERGADKIINLSQRCLCSDGSAQSNTMRLTAHEAGLLSIILDQFLKTKRRRSIYVGKERK